MEKSKIKMYQYVNKFEKQGELRLQQVVETLPLEDTVQLRLTALIKEKSKLKQRSKEVNKQILDILGGIEYNVSNTQTTTETEDKPSFSL